MFSNSFIGRFKADASTRARPPPVVCQISITGEMRSTRDPIGFRFASRAPNAMTIRPVLPWSRGYCRNDILALVCHSRARRNDGSSPSFLSKERFQTRRMRNGTGKPGGNVYRSVYRSGRRLNDRWGKSDEGRCLTRRLLESIRRGGETGRRTGLKILGSARIVWVRPPPPAPFLKGESRFVGAPFRLIAADLRRTLVRMAAPALCPRAGWVDTARLLIM